MDKQAVFNSPSPVAEQGCHLNLATSFHRLIHSYTQLLHQLLQLLLHTPTTFSPQMMKAFYPENIITLH